MIWTRLLFTWLTKNTFSKRTQFLLLYSLFTIPKNYVLPAKRKVSYMSGKLSISVSNWIFSNHPHSYCIHCKRCEMQRCHVFLNCCSPWWPFPYLVGVGLVLLLHSFRFRATYWVTPTPSMSSFIWWCHVFLGRLRRLVPGIASSITLRVTLVAYRLWTCPNQRRRPLRITSSIIIISTTGGSRLQRSHMVQFSCSM